MKSALSSEGLGVAMHNGILKEYAIDGTAIPSIFGARLAKDKTGAVSFRK